jgi:Na+/H+ antiporter NhaD/arsenite permease-like protein
MVWQKGKVYFLKFFQLLVPSAVNWLLPAACMSLGVDRFVPERSDDVVQLKYGAGAII